MSINLSGEDQVLKEKILALKNNKPNHRVATPKLYGVWYRTYDPSRKYWDLSDEEAKAWNELQDYHDWKVGISQEALEKTAEAGTKVVRNTLIGFVSGSIFTAVMFGVSNIISFI